MGCLGSKEEEQPKEVEKPTYSWERRDRPDPKDFTFSNLKGVTTGRKPGTINGQQFFIQNCEDCNIYLLDHTATVLIDDCINCKIVIGPSKGSVFFRDCKDCSCVVACQQFRTRDCKKMDFFLCCATQPIIEASTGIKFGCFTYYYPELEGQFEAAGMSIYNNSWSNIHDFTPAEGEATWALLPQDVTGKLRKWKSTSELLVIEQTTLVEELIPVPETEDLKEVHISTAQELSTIPVTLGSRRKPFDESCLVVFFHDDNVKTRVSKFLNEIKAKDSCVLVQTKEVNMKAEDVARVFHSEDYAAAANRGPVIGLEVNGNNSIQECKAVLNSLSESAIKSVVYISSTASKATQDIDGFYNFVDLSMT